MASRAGHGEAAAIMRAMSDYLLEHLPRQRTGSGCTLRNHRAALSLFLGYLEDAEGVTPATICRRHLEPAQIGRWVAHMRSARGNSARTCNRRLSCIRSFLRFLGQRDIALQYLYVESLGVGHPRDEARQVPGMPEAAVMALLRQPSAGTPTGLRDYTLLLVMYGTAARADEMLSLRVRDVRVGRRPYSITLHGKGAKDRVLPLLDPEARVLRAYTRRFHGDRPNGEDFLFYSRRADGTRCHKMTWAALDRRLKAYARGAREECPDVPLSPGCHQLRHARATQWLREGYNLLQIQALLGHESLATTQRYLSVDPEMKQRAMGAVETEEDRKARKKWKDGKGSLRECLPRAKDKS